ncbi:FitA-like ribbon-helix-helix domain-containing protein [Corynebacterium sp. AOP40-9SA-29]|uniref:FitA-like ribbon-helix-helix domain-containing protein n=1 Tax=Corynebacterium sp. AOP40-9SA-29 TaxID=3457677 RepID=UPI004034DFA3
MSMIQVRNVPEDLHRRLKARAASEGITLSDLVLRELARTAEVPTAHELSEYFAQRNPVSGGGESATDAIRAMRGAGQSQ